MTALYDVMLTGGKMDASTFFFVSFWFVLFATFAWALVLAFSVGFGCKLCDVMRELFRAICRWIRGKRSNKDDG